MAWPEQKFSSWEHFLQISSRVTKGTPFSASYIFRGAADASRSLKPTLLRQICPDAPPEEVLRLEKIAEERFRSNAHLFSSPSLPTTRFSFMDWWTLMQHHKAPTRLLDWTTSIFVAAYFAVEGHWDRDGAIWIVHGKSMCKPIIEKYGETLKQREGDFRNPEAPTLIQIWHPQILTDRMRAQQGLFTVSCNILADHEAIIDATCCPQQENGGEAEIYRKVIIPKNLKPQFLQQLSFMNITADALFPGVDGLGRSVTELTLLSSHFSKKSVE